MDRLPLVVISTQNIVFCLVCRQKCCYYRHQGIRPGRRCCNTEDETLYSKDDMFISKRIYRYCGNEGVRFLAAVVAIEKVE